MKIVHSVELHLPEGKLPGFYAQIVKGIANIVTLLDRDKTVLFVSSEAEAEAIEAFVRHYRVETDRGLWAGLDQQWLLDERKFGDYGIQSRSGSRYLDLGLSAIMEIAAAGESSELGQALEQCEEHSVARQNKDGRQLLAVDREQTELIAGIARAYRCQAELLL
ncbi:hypothetical protein [Paenibacillus nasutitermitis]|uniref:Uncharacterized protein n=1 Tax=Paenibacillus nasutitermitis TaxID=1652958 RepID=A0A917DU41_9BACL|nr:hypothetical protein [Paenibacillus nasutitermitis]GGD71167.1 hypothetical protein GCM10010911_31320 [Paenibacillus nasutitermitis]